MSISECTAQASQHFYPTQSFFNISSLLVYCYGKKEKQKFEDGCLCSYFLSVNVLQDGEIEVTVRETFFHSKHNCFV